MRDLVKKVRAKLEVDTFTLQDVSLLASQMKKQPPEEVPVLWNAFQEKHKVTKDKAIEILVNKVKTLYQVDLNRPKHGEAIDILISALKGNTFWT